MLLENVLGSHSYWLINKAIKREVGFLGAGILSEFIQRQRMWRQSGELDSEQGFWMDNTWLQKFFEVGYKSLSISLKKLEGAGFIITKQKQVNNVWRKFYYIQDAKVVSFLCDTDTLSEKVETPSTKGEENKVINQLNNKINKESTYTEAKNIDTNCGSKEPQEVVINASESTCSFRPKETIVEYTNRYLPEAKQL